MISPKIINLFAKIGPDKHETKCWGMVEINVDVAVVKPKNCSTKPLMEKAEKL